MDKLYIRICQEGQVCLVTEELRQFHFKPDAVLWPSLPEELIDGEKPKSVVNLLYKDAKSPHAARARHSQPPVVGQGNVVKSETHSKPSATHGVLIRAQKVQR